MKTKIIIPENFNGFVKFDYPSTLHEADIDVILSGNFQGTVYFHPSDIVILGRSFDEIQYVTQGNFTAESSPAEIKSIKLLERLALAFNTFSSIHSYQEVFFASGTILSLALSVSIKVLLKAMEYKSLRAKLKLLEEKRHSHIQFLVERRYLDK